MNAARYHSMVLAMSAATFVAAPPVLAQSYPSRPLRIIVPTSPGAGADFVARVIAPQLSERLGQAVAVENRAGAATLIGTEAAAKAPPDGYTLLLGVGTLATAPSMYRKLPYDALKDLAPITQLAVVSQALVVHPSLPVKSVNDLVALARKRPGEIAFASPGTGTLPHLSMELFLVMSGTRMLHIPYKGPGPGIVDLIAGRVSAAVSTTVSILPHVRSGKLRMLAVTTAKRSASVPDMPTIAESGVPGFESFQWYAMLTSGGVATGIVARLHKEVVALVQQREMKERFFKEGAEVATGTPEQFTAFLRMEIAKWAKVVKLAGIQPE